MVLESLEFEAPVAEVWPPEHHTRILFESPLRKGKPDQCVREVIKRFMTRAFRRPVSEEEVDHYQRIHKIYDAEFDTLEQAMRETLAMVLISPQFLYHRVIDDSETKRQYELASRLSYFLWGACPIRNCLILRPRESLTTPRSLRLRRAGFWATSGPQILSKISRPNG